MINPSALIIYEEEEFTVGEETFIDSVAENNYAVVFEDDGNTGYFYAAVNTPAKDTGRFACL